MIRAIMPRTRSLEAIIRRERALVVVGLAAIVLLSWAYTIYLARTMGPVNLPVELARPQMRLWGGPEFAMLFLMWVVMMAAMMTPSAAPMILMFAAMLRRRREEENAVPATALFLSGYLIAWTGFSLAATLLQCLLHATSLLSPMMVSTSPLLGGVLLLSAGVFQWTQVKGNCLRRCRTPLGFLLAEWREGSGGALVMGLRHGIYCIGCCWALMGLLLVGGVMNLLWVALISAFVLVEKIVPSGELVARLAGILFSGCGLWMIWARLSA